MTEHSNTSPAPGPVDPATRVLAERAIGEHGAIQKVEELAALAQLVADRQPRTVCEIGSARGGTFWLWTRLAPPDALLISIDLPGGDFGGGYSATDAERMAAWRREDQELVFLRRDSHSLDTLALTLAILGDRPIDFLFVDGDHTYDGCARDVDLYGGAVRAGGVIALHDIVPHSGVAECEVDRVWTTVRERGSPAEFVQAGDDRGWGTWGGIGAITLGDGPWPGAAPDAARTGPEATPALTRAIVAELNDAEARASRAEADVARSQAQARETQLQALVVGGSITGTPGGLWHDGWVAETAELSLRPRTDTTELIVRGWMPAADGHDGPNTLQLDLDGAPLGHVALPPGFFECRVAAELQADRDVRLRLTAGPTALDLPPEELRPDLTWTLDCLLLSPRHLTSAAPVVSR